MSRAAHQQGATAILLDGIARDATAMTEEGLPVYATELAVVGPMGRASIRSAGEVVEVGGVSAAPGDAVIVDASGATRVTAAEVDRVLDAASSYAAAEARVMAALAAGEPLVEAYRFKKVVVDEITSAVTERRRGR